MGDDEKRLGDQVDAAVAPAEVAEHLAEVAKAMKDALEHRGFAPVIADQAAVQWMFAVAAVSAGGPPR